VPNDPGPNKEAIIMLERSVGMDSGYAPAWEALGTRYYWDTTYSNGGEEMIRRSNSALERAMTLDPNWIPAATQLVVNRVERLEPRKAYGDAQSLVKQNPQSAQAHFSLAYVLRYAGMLEESTHECDTALALDPGNYQFRSCTWSFMQLGKTARARDFIRLDAGSEWASYAMSSLLLREGKVDEARESLKLKPPPPGVRRDALEVCLGPRVPVEFEKSVRNAEREAAAVTDPEPKYTTGAILSFCGQKESALRLLKSAIEQNYCSYSSLQSDPLLAKLRGTPEFSQLLSAGKECQARYLAKANN